MQENLNTTADSAAKETLSREELETFGKPVLDLLLELVDKDLEAAGAAFSAAFLTLVQCMLESGNKQMAMNITNAINLDLLELYKAHGVLDAVTEVAITRTPKETLQ